MIFKGTEVKYSWAIIHYQKNSTFSDFSKKMPPLSVWYTDVVFKWNRYLHKFKIH